jgi:type VI secretion system protein ImpH
MEGDERPGPADLTHLDALGGDPQAYHVFHAMRVVEAAFANRPRMGESLRPAQDRVRLAQEAELAFPPTTVVAFEPPSNDLPGRLVNRFFGLFGPNGPLPLHLTEYARDRQRNHHDPTLIAFADMFTHRMFGLLYRAWASAEPAPSFDRSNNDPFGDKLAALAGHRGRDLSGRDPMPDLAKRQFTGHLGLATRNPQGLVSIVSAFFRAPVAMQDFVGTWLELVPQDRWRLGARIGLGLETSLGRRVWSRASKFRLRLGPLSLDDYKRMLPGGTSLPRLEAIVRNYLGDVFAWDLNLVLRGDQVPKAILGQNALLGHVCWVGERALGRDADNLYLRPRGA